MLKLWRETPPTLKLWRVNETINRYATQGNLTEWQNSMHQKGLICQEN